MSAAPSRESTWKIRAVLDTDGAAVILRLAGRMGSSGADAARSALDEAAARSKDVRLDLGEVDYMSSAGIEVLRSAAAAIQALGGTLTLIAASEPVSVALKLAGEVPYVQLTTDN